MTVNTTDSKVTFSMDGSTVNFDFTFAVLLATDIKATIKTGTTETELTYTAGTPSASQYAASINSNGVGGTVTVGDAQDNTYTITIYREVAYTQGSDYDDYNTFPAETVEDSLDKVTMQTQQLAESDDRTAKGSITLSGVDYTLPIPEAGNAISWNDAEDGFENVILSPYTSTLQDAFDNGQTITIADTDNQILTITQNDTTNNPDCVRIANNGDGRALRIDNDGNGKALLIESTATTAVCLEILNSSAAHGINLNQIGDLAADNHGLRVYSNTDQDTASLVHFILDNASSDEPVLELTNAGSGDTLRVDNNGTGNGLWITQDGFTDANKHALFISSTNKQTNTDSALVRFQANNTDSTQPVLQVDQDHVGSSSDAVNIKNDGTGETLFLTNAGTGHGLYISQTGTLDPSKYAINVQSTANQSTTSALVRINQDSSVASADALKVHNDGVGDAIDIDTNGNGTGLYMNVSGPLQANKQGIYVQSAANNQGGNTNLMLLEATNASATIPILRIDNDTVGNGLKIDQDGNGISLNINHTSTNHGVYLNQLGVLGANKRTFNIISTAQLDQSSTALAYINLNNASATAPLLWLNQASAGSSIPLKISNAGSGVAIDVSDGDIRNVAWTDYSGTSTVVGWSSFTGKEISYKKVGNLVFVIFDLSGTSNSTSTNFTLPYANGTGITINTVMGYCVDGGVNVTEPAKILIASSSSQATLYPGVTGSTSWSSSGNKVCAGQFWYEANT